MELMEAVRRRKSIRAFRPDPIGRETIRSILEAACRAPSAMNTQPWEIYVATGEVLDTLREKNVACLRAGEPPEPEHVVVGWPRDSVYRTRQVELAKQLFALMGIEREDRQRRVAWMERGFRYFDAPAAIFVVVDRALTNTGPLLDIGAFLQTLCLVALEHGLGTCIEDQGVMYPRALRDVTGIPDSKRIMMAVAIGYPDASYPANAVETHREPADNLTTWLGFDETSP